MSVSHYESSKPMEITESKPAKPYQINALFTAGSGLLSIFRKQVTVTANPDQQSYATLVESITVALQDTDVTVSRPRYAHETDPTSIDQHLPLRLDDWDEDSRIKNLYRTDLTIAVADKAGHVLNNFTIIEGGNDEEGYYAPAYAIDRAKAGNYRQTAMNEDVALQLAPELAYLTPYNFQPQS